MECSYDENWSEDELIDDILGPEGLFNDEADENDMQKSGEEAEEKLEKSDKDSTEKGKKKIKKSSIIKNSRVTLNFDTLKGKNGLSALKKMFKNFKFKGNGHEKEDLSEILGILRHWMCYQLCPSYDFESCLFQLEALGKKKLVQTLMKKYRLGLDDWGENKFDEVNDGNSDINLDISANQSDLFLSEEIANVRSDEVPTQVSQTPTGNRKSIREEAETILTAEQLERIARNRKLAEERRLRILIANNELKVDLITKEDE